MPPEMTPSNNPPDQLATPPPPASDPMLVGRQNDDKVEPKRSNELDQAKAKHDQKAAAKAAKQPNKNITMAIVATVIIVLGLAAIAVYAYLKQKTI